MTWPKNDREPYHKLMFKKNLYWNWPYLWPAVSLNVARKIIDFVLILSKPMKMEEKKFISLTYAVDSKCIDKIW